MIASTAQTAGSKPSPRYGQCPRVLHFNDCADVGANLVAAASRAGYSWDYLAGAQVRPKRNPSAGTWSRLRWLPYWAKRVRRVTAAEVIHVHYATAVSLLGQFPVPRRPYLLHLHGSDIRRRWKEPQYHAQVQRAIDAAQKVFYTNIDTAEEATTACAQAQYMPAFVDFTSLPPWRLREDTAAKILFVSRWDEDKGVAAQLELVAALRRAFPETVLEGLDWGPGAPAAQHEGVRLVSRMNHRDYLHWLASGTVAVGQANRILAVSEFEAMAIGLPVVALGLRLPRPDDNSTPPVIEGNLAQVLEGTQEALHSPRVVAQRLGSKTWVESHHRADDYIELLTSSYRAAVNCVGTR